MPARADVSGKSGASGYCISAVEASGEAWVGDEGTGHERIAGERVCAAQLGFAADDRQAAVLDSQAKRGILNCTRQWGKSTVLAVKAVHRAWTEAGSLVLVASPSERQSAEFVRKAAGFLMRLGVPRRGDGDNASSLALPNGSRIVGLPGTEGTVRGFSAVSMLLIDEAARVQDATYKSLRPMLAVGKGDLWLMSTPRGQRGFFYESWINGGETWERHSVPATECPRIRGGVFGGGAGRVGEYVVCAGVFV